MSGFHPVLGLLAVAVCISFAKTTAFPFIHKDYDKGVEPQKPSQLAFVSTAKDDRQQESNSYSKGKQLSLNEGEEIQGANIGNDRNPEIVNKVSGFIQAMHSRAGGDAFRVKTRREDSESENPDKKSEEANPIFPRKDVSNSEYNGDSQSNHYPEALNSGKETSELKNGDSTAASNQGSKRDVRARSSGPEEDCDDEQNAQSGDSPTTESEGQSEGSKNSQEDENCTDEPVTDEGNQTPSTDSTMTTAPTKVNDSYASATSVSASTPTDGTMRSTPRQSSQSGGSNDGQSPVSSEECDESQENSQQGSHEHTVATTTSTKRPRNDDASSGSLGLDSGTEDVDFSDDETLDSVGVNW